MSYWLIDAFVNCFPSVSCLYLLQRKFSTPTLNVVPSGRGMEVLPRTTAGKLIFRGEKIIQLKQNHVIWISAFCIYQLRWSFESMLSVYYLVTLLWRSDFRAIVICLTSGFHPSSNNWFDLQVFMNIVQIESTKLISSSIYIVEPIKFCWVLEKNAHSLISVQPCNLESLIWWLLICLDSMFSSHFPPPYTV